VNHHFLNVELISSVSALPSNFELNSKEGYDLFGNDINKIITLTGINKRHLAPEGMSTLDLAYAAANRLIELNNINRSEIALIVYVSFTFENRLPGDVNKLVSLLKLPNNIIAIDLSSACSGYLTGLLMVSSILNSLSVNSVALMIDGDVQSRFVSKKDRGTYPVFGDAVNASLLKKSDFKSKITFLSMGEGQNDLNIKGFSSKQFTKLSDFDLSTLDGANFHNNFNIFMNGISVYNFVLNHVNPLIKEYLNDYNQHFDFFVPHQANEFITRNLAKRLGLGGKLLISSNEFGNVGSCSIPLTLTRHISNSSSHPFFVLISGFGAGLSANCTILKINPFFKSDIIYLGT